MIKTAFQLKTIGSLLRDKRKEKGLSIAQISEAIKIRGEYLTALEEGRYSAFPSEVYIKGFLRNYAKFLGISTDQALALYRRENEKKAEAGPIDVVNKLKEKGFAFTFTPNRVIAVIAAIALIIIILYLGTYVGRVLKKPDLKLTSPVAISEDQEGTFTTDANFIEIVGQVELGSRLWINDQELKLNNFEEFTKQFKIESGTNKFTIKAESQFGRDTTITLNVVKQAASLTPSITSANQIDAVLQVINAKTTVTVTVDGIKKLDDSLDVGVKQEFIAGTTFQITTPKPANISLTINGVAQTISAAGNTWDFENGLLVKK